MKFYGKALQAGEKILEVFKQGKAPKALAQVFITPQKKKEGKWSKDLNAFPSDYWSLQNQFLMVIFGHEAGAGYNQWKELGRNVKKGAKAFPILAPCTKTIEDENTGKKKTILYGFTSKAVFGYSQTEGEEVPFIKERQDFVKTLPLFEVAKSWGMKVTAGADRASHGWYSPSTGQINVNVKNLSTWCHELCHLADDRLNKLTPGQDCIQEKVAEFGGAVLLCLLGKEEEADLGGCLDYITYYSVDKEEAIDSACKLLNRVCKVVSLILEEAERLQVTEVKEYVAVN